MSTPTDMLVKLYNLPDDWNFVAEQEKLGIIIRKPIGVEKRVLVEWVTKVFSPTWGSAMDMALGNRPVSCFVAVKEGAPVGFSCYDAGDLGYLGPIGVAESERGKGTGTALLRAGLLDMKLKGYGYAIIGMVGPAEFYKKTVGAVEIPDSFPGIFKTRIKRDFTP